MYMMGDDDTHLELFWDGAGCRRFAPSLIPLMSTFQKSSYMQLFANKIACKDFFTYVVIILYLFTFSFPI